MSFMLILIFTICLLIAGVGISNSFSQGNEKKPVTSQKITNSSRAEIENMLKQIETKKAPEGRMGAMCYEMAAPIEYQEYVCPLDGQKTAYNRKDQDVYELVAGITEMKRLVERLNSVTNLAKFKLDEKRLCHTCSPDIKTNERYVTLITKYPDGRECLYEKVTLEDLRILAGFFERKLIYKSDREAEIPLKNEIGKIEKILGIQIENPSKEDKK
jgi:hypothetical protein